MGVWRWWVVCSFTCLLKVCVVVDFEVSELVTVVGGCLVCLFVSRSCLPDTNAFDWYRRPNGVLGSSDRIVWFAVRLGDLVPVCRFDRQVVSIGVGFVRIWFSHAGLVLCQGTKDRQPLTLDNSGC